MDPRNKRLDKCKLGYDLQLCIRRLLHKNQYTGLYIADYCKLD